ncbi:holin family protein [Andreesenia angusta]|uniref:Holin family protein n=1 Tax=Andreesenia angusta TaxID=39480 RepID=A0A1S1V8W7_9FIRM|nr:phage holin family protein [Andreesenia angusta]OHW63053.1 holin family protein [Andreesenia angusta]
MERINVAKTGVLSVAGTVGSFAVHQLGGWDMALNTLIIFMSVDYITGLVVAGVFNNSTKTEFGALESGAGFRGLCKKGMILAIVLMAYRLDMVMGSEFIRDAVIIAYIINESISIIENAGLMGLPVPSALKKAIEVLKSKSEEE